MQANSSDITYYEAVGRRKNATARVRLYLAKEGHEKGDMIVNGLPVEKYFFGEVAKKIYLEPFRTTNTIGRFVTSILVSGGGLSGQLGAVLQGISRALCKVDLE